LTDADGLGLISYQWQADGADIAGATGATFILAEAQVGKAITVRASYTDGSGHAESVTSSATTPVMLVPDLVVTPNANGGADIVITDPSQLTGDLGTSGIDQVVYSGSGTVILPDNIENLTLTGGNANGVGNDLRNVVRGSAGDNALQGMAGNDWINSGDGRDSIDGGVGADFIFGGSGTDLIDGGSGNDKLQGASGNDQIAGGAGKDSVYGGNGDDRLSGGVGHDRVNGGLGHDWISGGSGNDTLYGGSGQDRFVFDTKPNTISNVDKILDFKPSDDSIYLDEAIFTELGEGSDKGAAIGQEMFVSASRAQDAQDRIIYDQETGSLYYDRDGTGSAAQVKFATLSNKAKLSFHDFFVI
jgi:Ca2+-binding RTX toxin-like protein